MTITTLLKYLCGDRVSIERIAYSRNAVWLGGLFVLSAGLAREYDGEDLRNQPWHLLLPLAASLLTSLLLFSLVFAVARRRGCDTGPFLRLYRSFLGLYWMTAPLAWLYAIPVERFLSPGDATTANLCLLALVAAWRVALISRVLSVLFDAHYVAALTLVMLFADTLTLVILYFTPLPVFAIMGGIRLTQSERTIQQVAFLVGFLGIVTWPIWLIAAGAVGSAARSKWKLTISDGPADCRVGRSLICLAIASLVSWLPLLMLTQPEQRLRNQVEQNLLSGRLEEGIAILAAHERRAFPPHWVPPPRVGYGEDFPSVFDVLRIIEATNAPTWVRNEYLEKLDATGEGYYFGPWSELQSGSDEQVERILELLEELPEGPRLLEKQRYSLERLSDDKRRPAPLRARAVDVIDRIRSEPGAMGK